MRTAEESVTLCCPLTDLEQDLAATMMQMTGIASEANLVRVGLWHLAKHLNVPVGTAFSVRGRRGPSTSRLLERQLESA